MAWSIFQLAKVMNIAGTLAADGSLTASTTYYVKVIALDSMSATRVAVDQFMKNVLGEYSDTFTFTTDTTQKQINLTWNKVYKQDGTTEVDGYIVLLSTSDNFLTIANYSKIFVNPDSYYKATINTNAYTLATNPTRYWHNLQNGCPYFAWDGAAEASFDSLWDYIQTLANPTYWAQEMRVPNFYTADRPFAYTFLGEIYIARYTGDSAAGVYSFSMVDRMIAIFGGFSMGTRAKTKLWDSMFVLQGRTLGKNSSLFYNVSGNSHKNIILRTTLGTSGVHYTTAVGFIWGVASQAGLTTYPVAEGDVFENITLSCAENANIFPNGEQYPCSKVVTKGTYQTRNTIYYVRLLLGRGGSDIKAIGGYFWGITLTHGAVFANAYATVHNWFQQTRMRLIDCHWKYVAYTVQGGTKTAEGIYPIITRDITYNTKKRLKKLLNMIWKSIKVNVVDEATKLPIENAKVYFYGKNGEKLTWGNNEVDVVNFEIPKQDTSYNYDENEVNFTPEDTNVWFKKLTSGAWGTTLTELAVGQEYWAGGERVKILEKLSDVGPTNWQKYTVERGVSGTMKGWMTGDFDWSDLLLVVARDYLTTDVNGECFNITLLSSFRELNYNDSYRRYIPDFISNGDFDEQQYYPITVEIRKSGYKTMKVILSLETIELSLNKTLVVEAAMSKIKDLNFSKHVRIQTQ